MLYKVSDLRKFILKLGIDYSNAQIHRLQEKGIVFCDRLDNEYRVFTEENFKKSVKNIILYYLSVPLDEIKGADPTIIKDRVSKILLAVKRLQ